MPEKIDLNAFEGGGVRLDVEALQRNCTPTRRGRKEGKSESLESFLQTAKKRTQTRRGAPFKFQQGSLSLLSFANLPNVLDNLDCLS
jgi:hypothetical protein